MFHGDAEKALWYLNRALVEVVSREPPILRFAFRPGGPGHVGDAFYLAGKVNRCVVCGSEEGLNRHHVVPRVYRRHLPPEVKEHSHHDVLLLCVACHERYERAADALRAELSSECGVPPHGLRGQPDRQRGRARAWPGRCNATGSGFRRHAGRRCGRLSASGRGRGR